MKYIVHIKNNMLFFAILLLAILFQAIPFFNIFMSENLAFAPLAKNSTIGFIAISFLIISFFCAWFFLNAKRSLPLILLFSSLFLYYFNLLISTIYAILFFEFIYFIGVYFFKILHKEEYVLNSTNTFTLFIAGFGIFTAVEIAIFYSNVISISTFQIIIASLSVISLFINRKSLITFHYYKKVSVLERYELGAIYFLFILIILQLAKGTYCYDYDSLWYSLRPEQVLIPNKSFLEATGLVQFVHYYPKLMEVFFIPITIKNHYSFLYAGNTIILLMMSNIIYIIYREFISSRLYSILFTILIISIPTINNLASTAKSDMLTTFFLVLVIYFIIRIAYDGISVKYFSLFVTCIFFALSMKYSSYMFLPAIATIIIGISIYLSNINNNPRTLIFNNLKAYIVLPIIAMFIYLGINYRTYHLTGYPTYPLLFSLWNDLGIKGVFPFNLFNPRPRTLFLSDFFSKSLQGFYQYNFNPSKMPHVLISWTGNILLFTTLIILLSLKKTLIYLKKNITFTIILAIIFCEYIVLRISFLFGFSRVYGADGNYLMFPIIILTILTTSILFNTLTHKQKQVFLFASSFFILFQFFYTYNSHWSGRIGIRKNKPSKSFCLNDSQSSLETDFYKPLGASNLVRHLQTLPYDTKALFYYPQINGRTLENKPFPIQIQTTYNSFAENTYGVSSLGTNINLLKQYLRKYNFTHIIEKQGHYTIPAFDSLLIELKEDTSIKQSIIDNFVIYDLRTSIEK